MTKNILLLCLVTGLCTAVQADPTFYVAPNAYKSWSSTLDIPWQTAVGDFLEEDFDSYTSGYDLDTFTIDSIIVDVGLGGINGTASTAKIFAGSWGGTANGSTYGTVYGDALLNWDSSGVIHSEITFDFSTPVKGVGAWIYDNSSSTYESFRMIVTEVGGTEYISNVLESNNGTPHFVEGWLGATSTIGIQSVSFQVLNNDGDPVAISFEMDHFQVSPVPVPAAAILGILGLSVAGIKLRKYT